MALTNNTKLQDYCEEKLMAKAAGIFLIFAGLRNKYMGTALF